MSDASSVGEFEAAAGEEGEGRWGARGEEGELAQDEGGGVAGEFC